MSAAKTQLDIHLSATNAAIKAIGAACDHAADQLALETFDADGNDVADWPTFKQVFNDRRNLYHNLATQPSPSVTAAKAAAAKAVADAKAASVTA